jgi:hypothetical protein
MRHTLLTLTHLRFRKFCAKKGDSRSIVRTAAILWFHSGIVVMLYSLRLSDVLYRFEELPALARQRWQDYLLIILKMKSESRSFGLVGGAAKR